MKQLNAKEMLIQEVEKFYQVNYDDAIIISDRLSRMAVKEYHRLYGTPNNYNN